MSEYKLGKRYLVPTVRGYWHRHMTDWPVFTPLHEDAEHIEFPTLHHHIDWRFVAASDWEYASDWGYFRPLLGTPLTAGASTPNPEGLPAPVLRWRSAKRSMPTLPFGRARWLPGLAAAHADCKLKPGMICPHRGADLTGLPVVDGKVTCPAHGLTWAVETGELVRNGNMNDYMFKEPA